MGVALSRLPSVGLDETFGDAGTGASEDADPPPAAVSPGSLRFECCSLSIAVVAWA